MKVGDIVVSNGSGFILRSGCSVYSHAIVVQTEPLVLVSEGTDMRWETTVQSDKVTVVGVADKDILARCMKRL